MKQIQFTVVFIMNNFYYKNEAQTNLFKAKLKEPMCGKLM